MGMGFMHSGHYCQGVRRVLWSRPMGSLDMGHHTLSRFFPLWADLCSWGIGSLRNTGSEVEG